MCVGIPLRLVAIDGIVGEAMNGDEPERVDLSLTPEARPGDWVLGFLGSSRAVLSPQEAAQIRAALGALASIARGEGLGDAFADLESREPQLPPHLKAALDAGRSHG